MTSVTSHQTDITVQWDTYDQSSVLGCSLQYNPLEWYKHTDDIVNNNYESIISKDDLDMVAHTFYLRKQELERVSYPDPVEEETVFYDCEPESKEIKIYQNSQFRSARFRC